MRIFSYFILQELQLVFQAFFVLSFFARVPLSLHIRFHYTCVDNIFQNIKRIHHLLSNEKRRLIK